MLYVFVIALFASLGFSLDLPLCNRFVLDLLPVQVKSVWLNPCVSHV
jgi:hypothetical protein